MDFIVSNYKIIRIIKRENVS